MNEEAAQFLRTGTLSGIRLGAPVDDVVRTLGEPTDCAQVNPGTQLLRYGSGQLTLTHGHVTAIALTDVDGDPTPQEVGALLLEAGIDWGVDPDLTFDKQLSLRADNGLRVLFDLERGTLQRIISEVAS